MIEQKFNNGDIVQCADNPKFYDVHGVQDVWRGAQKTKAVVVYSLSHTMEHSSGVMRVEYLLWNYASGYFLACQNVWHQNGRIERTALRRIDAKPINAFLLEE